MTKTFFFFLLKRIKISHFVFNKVLYVLQSKNVLSGFVLGSITTSCIGLCYSVSIWFASFMNIRGKDEQQSEFKFKVYCGVDKPSARQNRVNNYIKKEYFSRSEIKGEVRKIIFLAPNVIKIVQFP